MSALNTAAVKRYALTCSKAYKGGKFTRVGEDFLEEVEADVEALVRSIVTQHPAFLNPQLETPTVELFVTGTLMDKIKKEVNSAIHRLIKNKVCKQPSVGKTIGRTR